MLTFPEKVQFALGLLPAIIVRAQRRGCCSLEAALHAWCRSVYAAAGHVSAARRALGAPCA